MKVLLSYVRDLQKEKAYFKKIIKFLLVVVRAPIVLMLLLGIFCYNQILKRLVNSRLTYLIDPLDLC